jgi:phospholipid N-methyltransferase
VPLSVYRRLKQNIKEDGLVISSSMFLVEEMLGKIDFSKPMRILEIGSGKGVFTRQIVKRMTPDSRLDVSEIKVEYNSYIQEIIKDNPDKQISLYNGCITEFPGDCETYDIVLSSLPLKNFMNTADNNAFLNKVIRGLESNLKVGGTYLQYQYFRSNKADIENVFGKKMNDISFVFLNILPAFVYSITK